MAYENRTAINVPLLDRILSLRREAAKVLEKDNWAAYVIEPKMAHDPKTVFDFLNDLREKISPIAKKERETLLNLKREEIKELGLDTDPDRLYLWVRLMMLLDTESTPSLLSNSGILISTTGGCVGL